MEVLVFLSMFFMAALGTQDYQNCKKDFTAPKCEWAKKWCDKVDESCKK